MTETGTKDNEKTVFLSKRGYPKYETNPSIPNADSISKRKPRKIGNDKKGMIVNENTGEILSMGGVGFYEFEEVDDTRFVKLFLAGIKQAAGLSKAGLAVFELVYKQMQDKAGIDQIGLSYEQARLLGVDMSERVFRNGVRDLLEKGFLFESLVSGLFFVNIQFMFNGDRLAFVKGYKRKSAKKDNDQLSLFDDTESENDKD